MPAFVYWLAGTLAIQRRPDAPTVGDDRRLHDAPVRLFFPLGQLLNVQVEIQGALALFDRIFEYLEMEPEIVDAPDAVDARPRDGPGQASGSATFASGTRRRRSPRPGRHEAVARTRPIARRVRGGGDGASPQPQVDDAGPRGVRGRGDRAAVRPPEIAGSIEIAPAVRPGRASTSRRSRASWSRWSVRRARARRRRPTSSRGCTTSTPARSRSTASTSAGSSSRRSARSSAS